MNWILKGSLITASVLFLVFIISMVRSRQLELKYTLTWLLAGAAFLIIAVFDGIIYWIASILSIKEPVNALFLVVFFFILLILFTLSVTISKMTENMRTLAQEIALIKRERIDSDNEEN